MRYPSVTNFFDNLFDDFEDEPLGLGMGQGLGLMRGNGCHGGNCMMSTDVREESDKYKLAINMPGFKKADIKVKLDDGMLTVSAENKVDEEDKDKEGKLIRRERYTGSVSRSWYVGDELKQEDIKAKFADGVLTLSLPKQEEKKELPEEDKYISIEG